MSVAVITTSAGLIGSEAARFFSDQDFHVVGIDNDMRREFFGDNPNRLPLVELDTRWEISREHPYYEFGIDESMSVDQTRHSLFGASKLAAGTQGSPWGSSIPTWWARSIAWKPLGAGAPLSCS